MVPINKASAFNKDLFIPCRMQPYISAFHCPLPIAFLIQVVPTFLAMSSCHLLLGRPPDIFLSPWLPLCAAFSPPKVHSCYMPGPFPRLFQRVFYKQLGHACKRKWLNGSRVMSRQDGRTGTRQTATGPTVQTNTKANKDLCAIHTDQKHTANLSC